MNLDSQRELNFRESLQREKCTQEGEREEKIEGGSESETENERGCDKRERE